MGGWPLWPPAAPRLAASSSQSNPRGSGPEVLKRERGHVTAESGVSEVGVFRALQPNEFVQTRQSWSANHSCHSVKLISVWRKIMIPIYRLWLNGLYGLYGPRCPLSPERPLKLITHSLINRYVIQGTDTVYLLLLGCCLFSWSDWCRTDQIHIDMTSDGYKNLLISHAGPMKTACDNGKQNFYRTWLISMG